MEIADSTFLMGQMKGIKSIVMVNSLLVVMVKKMNCCGINKQPQQKEKWNFFQSCFQNLRFETNGIILSDNVCPLMF